VVAEGGSIYPDDVVRVEQVFFKGALALIKDIDNKEIGQGLVNYSAYDVQSFIDNPMLAKVPRPPSCPCISIDFAFLPLHFPPCSLPAFLCFPLPFLLSHRLGDITQRQRGRGALLQPGARAAQVDC
jgi:hypothetical protein